MANRRRITLMMDLAGSYGRGLYQGMVKYAKSVGYWEFWTKPSTVWGERDDPWQWDVDGAMVFGLWTSPVHEAARRGIPMVNLTGVKTEYAVPTMEVDHMAVGKLAAEHLLSRGLKHMGYVGWPESSHSQLRGEGFRQALQGQATFSDHEYDIGITRANRPIFPEPDLMQWLAALPKPVGIFAANDERASMVADAARAAALAVPEQVAILGVDDDELVRQRSVIPLSTIELPASRVGYEAAALLDHMMDGETPKPKPATDFPPVRVITRQSTEVSAVDDADVASAMRYIRDHAVGEIGMEDVANAVAVSTRVLELRFRKAIGRTPVEFLIQTRLEQARRLLIETDLKMAVIAKRSGFCSMSHFGAIFRQYAGMTPTAYRENSRITG